MTDATTTDLPALRATLVRRQSSLRKHDAVRRAATELFLAHGYAGVSMDAIAERAAVSKKTLYSHFANKDALFAAVLETLCSSVLAEPPTDEEMASADLPALLERISIDFLTAIYAPEQVELLRTVIGGAKAFPEIGAMMINGPFRRTEQIVEKLLRRRVKAGDLAIAQPDLAAVQFIGMLKTDWQFRLLLCTVDAVPAKEIRRVARATVGLFLNGAVPR